MRGVHGLHGALEREVVLRVDEHHALVGGAEDWALILVAAVAFGLAHAYQGRVGIVTTGLLGGVMAALYLGTGSLLLPVLLHALIDRNLRRGLATLCLGGGNAVALLVERNA